ncbi:unnamed protein product [Periconia digitata]|uniref:Uncharacterized protein n=1 Tax=Periconia digitata TaxID=1303443 RepID=A0A9W4UBQ2_9PLEO|nr:unnamed protein product [Periconia digitata]
MASSAGTKVTDPHNTKPESVGVVTSDSLAAESLQESGTFGSGNPNAAASKQPSHSTTTNNTDTSGATTLPPGSSAAARDAQNGQGGTQPLQAGKEQGKNAGVGPTYNTPSTSSSSSTGPSSTSGAANASSVLGTVAGGYAGASETAQNPGVKQPKGKNLTEDSNLEGKTAFGEVGTEQDPGRVAEQAFAQRAAQPGADAGYEKSKLQDGESKFSGLGDEAA